MGGRTLGYRFQRSLRRHQQKRRTASWLVEHAKCSSQLKEQIVASAGKLIWVSGDWNLADALTKKHRSSREGLQQFIKSQIWKLRYDPGFVCSEKKTRRQGLEAVRQMKQLQSLIPFAGPDSRKLWNWCDETGSIES